MAPHENPGDIDLIPHFLAQHRARYRPAFDEPGPWLTSPAAIYNPDEPSFPTYHSPACSGKATSHYSVASSSTEQTRVTSVFSAAEGPAGPTTHTAWAAVTRDDHPDRRELSDDELRLLHVLGAAPEPALLASHRMPCEFTRYTGCTATFDAFTQVAAWIRHELEHHLGWEPPPTCLCWFCDDFKFVTGLTGCGDNKENFQKRMMHIAGHFQEETVDARGIRPDFFFLVHIWEKGLIGQEVFEREKEVHEEVQVEGLRPRGYKTRRMEKEEERRGAVVVSTGSEKRDRRREARRARDKG